MVSTRFLIQDSQEKGWFFEETILLANINMEVIIKILFLFFSNANVQFAELGKLTWRLYTAAEALPTTNWVELINKKEFAKITLNKNSETFVIHVTALKIPIVMLIHFFMALQVLNNLTLATLQ